MGGDAYDNTMRESFFAASTAGCRTIAGSAPAARRGCGRYRADGRCARPLGGVMTWRVSFAGLWRMRRLRWMIQFLLIKLAS